MVLKIRVTNHAGKEWVFVDSDDIEYNYVVNNYGTLEIYSVDKALVSASNSLSSKKIAIFTAPFSIVAEKA